MFDQGKHLTAVPGLPFTRFDASTPCDTQVFSTLLAMEFNKKEKNGTRHDEFFYDDSQRSSDDPKSEHLPWCSGLADLMTRWRRADAGQVSRASFRSINVHAGFPHHFLFLGTTSISFTFLSWRS